MESVWVLAVRFAHLDTAVFLHSSCWTQTSITARHHKPTIPKHAGSIILRECSTAAGPGSPMKADGKMNTAKYREQSWRTISFHLQENYGFREHLIKDSHPKHPAKPAHRWFKDNQSDVLRWPSQRLNLNLMGSLWLTWKERAARMTSTQHDRAGRDPQETNE